MSVRLLGVQGARTLLTEELPYQLRMAYFCALICEGTELSQVSHWLGSEHHAVNVTPLPQPSRADPLPLPQRHVLL